jgi:hypothetical protein
MVSEKWPGDAIAWLHEDLLVLDPAVAVHPTAAHTMPKQHLKLLAAVLCVSVGHLLCVHAACQGEVKHRGMA